MKHKKQPYVLKSALVSLMLLLSFVINISQVLAVNSNSDNNLLDSLSINQDELTYQVYQGLIAGEKALAPQKNQKLKKGELITDGSQLVDGKLQPGVWYLTGEFNYFYKTDECGCLKEFTTKELAFTQRPSRLPHNPQTPGKLPGDHAGHMAAHRFGGSQELDNLVSQSAKVNLSTYKRLENQWARALKIGKEVAILVEIDYAERELRPQGFDVNFGIEGELFSTYLINQ